MMRDAANSAHLALRTEGVEHETVEVTDDYTYGRAIAQRWAGDDDLIVIEHDVVPWPGAVGTFRSCPALLCAFPYSVGFGQVSYALGCTRFSRALMRDCPALVSPDTHWRDMDHLVFRAVELFGVPHLHSPAVAHARELVYVNADAATQMIRSQADFDAEATRQTHIADDLHRAPQ